MPQVLGLRFQNISSMEETIGSQGRSEIIAEISALRPPLRSQLTTTVLAACGLFFPRNHLLHIHAWQEQNWASQVAEW